MYEVRGLKKVLPRAGPCHIFNLRRLVPHDVRMLRQFLHRALYTTRKSFILLLSHIGRLRIEVDIFRVTSRDVRPRADLRT